jgi:hypothetical protein
VTDERTSPTVIDAEEWFREACRLDAENRQLRRWLTNILILVATRDDLLAVGLEEIERRWPEGGA